jgi:hypothetical protein
VVIRPGAGDWMVTIGFRRVILAHLKKAVPLAATAVRRTMFASQAWAAS